MFIKNLSFNETESPAFSFWVPLGTETLRPFSLCNVHGTWEGEQFNLSEASKTGDLERDCIAEKNIASKKKFDGKGIPPIRNEDNEYEGEERAGGNNVKSNKHSKARLQREIRQEYVLSVSNSEKQRQELGYYTRKNPGLWSGKEGAHIPVLQRCGPRERRTFTVKVEHVMQAPKLKKKRSKKKKKTKRKSRKKSK